MCGIFSSSWNCGQTSYTVAEDVSWVGNSSLYPRISEEEECGRMWPRSPPNLVWVVRSPMFPQRILGVFTPVHSCPFVTKSPKTDVNARCGQGLCDNRLLPATLALLLFYSVAPLFLLWQSLRIITNSQDKTVSTNKDTLHLNLCHAEHICIYFHPLSKDHECSCATFKISCRFLCEHTFKEEGGLDGGHAKCLTVTLRPLTTCQYWFLRATIPK